MGNSVDFSFRLRCRSRINGGLSIKIDWGTLSPKGRAFIIAEFATRWLDQQQHQRLDLERLRVDLLQDFLNELVEEIVGSLPIVMSRGQGHNTREVCPDDIIASVVPPTASSRRMALNGFAMNYLIEQGRGIPDELMERLQATGVEWIQELEQGESE